MRSSSPIPLCAFCFALVLALGGVARAQAPEASPDGGAPDATNATPTAAPTQVQLNELLERIRKLEAERDKRTAEAATAPAATPPSSTQNPFVLGGYVEAYYQWNFNNPSNGITNYRGFDNRHNSFTLSNVALDAQWDYQNLVGRATLQVGSTPSTYYLAEPAAPGSSGANASGVELWKYVQQAYVGYRFHVLSRPLTVSAGIFLSPIGPESLAVKDSWNWSRSDLFFGLPFYHTGLRATYGLADAWALTVHLYNGWNSVVDNNDEKSVSAQLTFTRADVIASVLYFGGIERPRGAPEGRAWRHDFDANVTWNATPWLSLMAHANGGFEPNNFGTSAWAAGALSARFRLVKDKLFFAVRGDAFYEHVPSNAAGSASPLFWPVPWVTEGTATLDYRPHERVSFRLEYRHDHAGGDMFFGGKVTGDGDALPFVANRASQDTLTLGATTWF